MKNLVFIILITTSLLSAQQITIKGIITDSRTARPLFGANISLLESSSIGTTSQKDGKFILNDVAINSILKISYVTFVIIGQLNHLLTCNGDRSFWPKKMNTATGRLKKSQHGLKKILDPTSCLSKLFTLLRIIFISTKLKY